MDGGILGQEYRFAPMVWSGKPHPHLVAETANPTLGSTLDFGTGEGADAIWLAERGWQVTAVDLSTVSLERGRKQADDLGAATAQKITWSHADLTEWERPSQGSISCPCWDNDAVKTNRLPQDREALSERTVSQNIDRTDLVFDESAGHGSGFDDHRGVLQNLLATRARMHETISSGLLS